MFTIYIHILEVCGMYLEGASMTMIHDMGICYSMTDIQRGVISLEKEEYITRTRKGNISMFHITEKALEYCETVVRVHDRAVAVDNEAKKRTPEKMENEIVALAGTIRHERGLHARIALSVAIDEFKLHGDKAYLVEFYVNATPEKIIEMVAVVDRVTPKPRAYIDYVVPVETITKSDELLPIWSATGKSWVSENGCAMCGDPVKEGYILCGACLWGQ